MKQLILTATASAYCDFSTFRQAQGNATSRYRLLLQLQLRLLLLLRLLLPLVFATTPLQQPYFSPVYALPKNI
jgi:hypothetical protein